jgi:hypothetical protein
MVSLPQSTAAIPKTSGATNSTDSLSLSLATSSASSSSEAALFEPESGGGGGAKSGQQRAQLPLPPTTYSYTSMKSLHEELSDSAPTNAVKLHLYDDLANGPDSALFWHLSLGGVSFVGVEVNGTEYSYSGTTWGSSECGIKRYSPKKCEQYIHRATIELGSVSTKRFMLQRTWDSTADNGEGKLVEKKTEEQENDDIVFDLSFLCFAESCWKEAMSEVLPFFFASPREETRGAHPTTPNKEEAFATAMSSLSCDDRDKPSKEPLSIVDLEFVTGKLVVSTMMAQPDWAASNYDACERNCLVFARELCVKLGIRKGALGYFMFVNQANKK